MLAGRQGAKATPPMKQQSFAVVRLEERMNARLKADRPGVADDDRVQNTEHIRMRKGRSRAPAPSTANAENGATIVRSLEVGIIAQKVQWSAEDRVTCIMYKQRGGMGNATHRCKPQFFRRKIVADKAKR